VLAVGVARALGALVAAVRVEDEFLQGVDGVLGARKAVEAPHVGPDDVAGDRARDRLRVVDEDVGDGVHAAVVLEREDVLSHTRSLAYANLTVSPVVI
jgi:hypothetical protein